MRISPVESARNLVEAGGFEAVGVEHLSTVSVRPLIALVVEDDPLDFEILQYNLRSAGFHPVCRRVESEAEFVAHLKPGIDVVFSDYTLPGWNALRALELFRASRLDIPFIVVSGTISEEVAVECMKQGASDYLLKDRLGRLGPAVTQAIEALTERRLVDSLSTRLLKAHEEERKKIARELHDQIGQGIAVLLMELHGLNAELEAGDSAHSRLEGIVALVQEHEVIVRDMGLLLRPYMLDDLGLIPALNWQSREVSRRSGMKVTVDAGNECNLLSDEYRTCIYRVVQESLRNAARHARAQNVTITIRREPAQVRVEIEDDGCGFDTRCTKGMGMLGIEERARHLGGECRFDSEPGRGSRISFLLPRVDRRSVHNSPWAGMISEGSRIAS
jgi:signal transduction histidine kinase